MQEPVKLLVVVEGGVVVGVWSALANIEVTVSDDGDAHKTSIDWSEYPHPVY